MTVVALFGSSRALQLASRSGPIHIGRPGCSGAAAAPQLSLHLTNNSVVAFGGDVLDALGWEFGLCRDERTEAPEIPSAHSGAEESFAMILHGTCSKLTRPAIAAPPSLARPAPGAPLTVTPLPPFPRSRRGSYAYDTEDGRNGGGSSSSSRAAHLLRHGPPHKRQRSHSFT
jgi:hypothetical protein